MTTPGRVRSPRKIDQALTDMQEHLDWLRDHRAPSGDPWYDRDVAREIGVQECMDTLTKYGAKVLR